MLFEPFERNRNFVGLGRDVGRRGHRASVKRQVAPVVSEGRAKINGPKEPANLVG